MRRLALAAAALACLLETSSAFCGSGAGILLRTPRASLPTSRNTLQAAPLRLSAQLSDKAMQLLGRLKERPMFDVDVVGGGACRDAFLEQRHLTDEELENVRARAEDGTRFEGRLALVQALRAGKDGIVAAGQDKVAEFPGIYEPGGALYPPVRKEHCEKDFHTYLQIVTYATAAGRPLFSNEEGVEIMQEMFGEMKVPVEPMIAGVRGLKEESRRVAQVSGHEEAWPVAAGAWEHLITCLSGVPVSA